MMCEVWKDVPNYIGLYEVSNFGNVRNAKTLKKLSLGKHRQGYLLVTLTKNSKKKTFLVHRVVANAFIKNPNALKEVNHKDEIKSNNNVSNLEWCDRKYNSNYGTAKERMIKTKIKNGTNVGSKKTRNAGENNPNSKLKNSDVIFIRENYIKNHKEFGGVALAKKFGVRRECIYGIIMNKRRVML